MSNLPNGCTSSDIPETGSTNYKELNENEAAILDEIYYKLTHDEFDYLEDVKDFIETRREQFNHD